MDTSTYKNPRRVAPLAAAELVVQALLTAHRDNTLLEWLHAHPRIGAWLSRHHLGVVMGAAGDSLKANSARDQATAVEWLLRWAISQTRPDRASSPIRREDWLSRTSWRPALSVMCHYGFEPVQAFRDRYHAQADEAPASHLCGLWSVGPSTYYRYLEKAKHGIASMLRRCSHDANQRLSLRAAVGARVAQRLMHIEADSAAAWHAEQARHSMANGEAASGLWHWHQAERFDDFTALLRQCAVELANSVETDVLIDQVSEKNLAPRQRFELLLAQAALWRMRGSAEREFQTYEQALRIASSADSALMLGRVYGALGKFYEPRDADRAFACYQDCTDHLWRAGVGSDNGADDVASDLASDAVSNDLSVIEEFVIALVRLAWSHVLRNDPRSKITLDRADALNKRHALSLSTTAMLEQTWGEYWRRAGDLTRALEHKHRALNLYERSADQGSVLKTYSNLALIYGEAKDFPRAIDYSQRVLDMALTMEVEPELVASTRLNLGATYFWKADYPAAREQYELALDLALRSQLRLMARRAHYNLAEVAYLQFKASQDAADEARGDLHAEAALTVWSHESDPTHAQAIKKLKLEILGSSADRSANQLAPQEAVLHPVELAEVQVQRDTLAVPSAPDAHVRAHLRIAAAYLMIAMKERETGIALMQRHAMTDQFSAELAALQTTFERELTYEQQLTRQWAEQARDLLTTARCNAVLARLIMAGALNKSGYAELCALSPATASKHLATLAQRGLLTQTGKGPSTRYVLPDVSSKARTGISTITP